MRDSLDVPGETGKPIDERFERRIHITAPVNDNERLERVLEAVNADDDLYAQWIASNVTAIERLGMTDHGPVHVKIVTNVALEMLRLLMQGGVQPSVVTHYAMSPHDAEVVVVLAALMHDLGMSIHRLEHESYSLFLADAKLRQLLPPIYEPPVDSIVRSEILHAIISHRSGGAPMTVEAGVVRIADALDMAKGRSRIPFERGSISIHSVSAAAIEAVELTPGEERPVRVLVRMSNSAGVFQVDKLFRDKLRGSGIEQHLEIEAVIEGETEKSLVTSFKV